MKIPEDKLSPGAMNDWFSEFGTVTNLSVTVDATSGNVLVRFAIRDDTKKTSRTPVVANSLEGTKIG